MKIGIASGKLNGTKQHKQEQPNELQIMDGANYIKHGKPVYQLSRRSAWSVLVTRIARIA